MTSTTDDLGTVVIAFAWRPGVDGATGLPSDAVGSLGPDKTPELDEQEAVLLASARLLLAPRSGSPPRRAQRCCKGTNSRASMTVARSSAIPRTQVSRLRSDGPLVFAKLAHPGVDARWIVPGRRSGA